MFTPAIVPAFHLCSAVEMVFLHVLAPLPVVSHCCLLIDTCQLGDGRVHGGGTWWFSILINLNIRWAKGGPSQWLSFPKCKSWLSIPCCASPRYLIIFFPQVQWALAGLSGGLGLCHHCRCRWRSRQAEGLSHSCCLCSPSPYHSHVPPAPHGSRVSSKDQASWVGRFLLDLLPLVQHSLGH